MGEGRRAGVIGKEEDRGREGKRREGDRRRVKERGREKTGM